MTTRREKAPLAVAQAGGITTLTLHLAEGLLTDAGHAALAEAAERIDLDDEVRVVVLRGSGAAFCRGGRAGTRDDGIAAVAGLRVPVVAALHGEVLDEGLELAMAADLRVAAKGTRFGLTQLLRGELPSHGGTQRLPRLIGRAAAGAMLLLGETIPAARAARLGLVHEVVERDALARRTRALARGMAQRGPAAQRLAKEALRAALDLPLSEGLRLEGDLYVLLQSTEDREEGIASFREKRRPRYRGR